MSRRTITACMFATVASVTAMNNALGYVPMCDRAKYDLLLLEGAIESYRIETGALPGESQWFDELVRNSEMSAAMSGVDPWGNQYLYRVRGGDFDLFTAGPDGLANTSDDQVRTDRWQWRVCRPRRSSFGCTTNR